MSNKAKAPIRRNMFLQDAGRQFFDDENGPANIQLELRTIITRKDIDILGENFEERKNVFLDFLLLATGEFA